MMSLTKWRSARVCRIVGLWAAVSTGMLPLGCADRASNSDAETPVAVTGDGVRIVRVERNEAARTIAADVEAAGTVRTVTVRPLDAGPLPTGLTARIDGSAEGAFEMSVAWDAATGTVWMRQSASSDVLVVSRAVQSGRVHETCELNGNRVDMDYPEMPDEQIDKAIARWRHGDLDLAPPGIRELGDGLAQLDAMAAEYAQTSLATSTERGLLLSLWNDPVFAGAISGEPVDPLRWENPARALCGYLALCMSISCRMNLPVCGFCTTGVISCLIVHVACAVIGCDCCY
jgi:hypothetical protein